MEWNEDDSTALEAVLEKLDGVRKQGGYWMARCPAHEDTKASLSVARGTQQPVVFKCHAGCHRDDILLALGMTLQEVSAPPGERVETSEWTPRGPAVACYHYRDEKGVLLFDVLRTATKDFPLRVPDPLKKSGWRWSLGETRRVLYRLPELLAAIEAGKRIWVCYAEDTEVLTPGGWVPLPKLATDTEVAQYDTGTVEFVRPAARQVFGYTGSMVSIEADWSGLLVTPDHRVLCKWKTSQPVTIRAEEVGQQRWLPVAGVRTVNGSGPTENEARLLAAWQADGVNCARGHRVAWNLRKERKKARLRHLLAALDIAWREQEFPAAPGWTYLTIDRRDVPLLDRLPGKRFGWDILDWPAVSRVALLEELGYWDGDRPGREGIRYFTADEQNAEVISAVAATTGYGSIVRCDDRPERPEQGPQWVVSLVPRDWRTLGHAPGREDYDGPVYCLTVPSGYLVTRRRGKVTIAGNCEGEKDADRLYREGEVATCNPGGAGKWQPEYAEIFEGADVTIVADCDTTGRAHARAVARALTGVASTIEIREAATGKDVSNHLDAGKTLDELETTRENEKQDSTMGISLVAFLSTPDDPQAWVIKDILERGDRLILTGGEGLGKSTLTRQLAVGAASGIHPFTLHFGQRMKVLFIDCENKDRKSKRRFRPLAEAVAGMQRPLTEEGFRIHHIPAGIDLTKGDWSGFLIEQVTAYRPDLLVCGPLYKLHAVDISEETAARTIVNVLEDAMSVSDCALITEAHMAKGSSSETRDLSPAGSRLFLGWPDAGYGLRASKPGDRRRVKVIPWRGDREERKWPRELMWNNNYVGMPWVEPMDEANPSWRR